MSAGASRGQSLQPTLLIEPSPPPRITRAGLTFDPMCPAGISGVCVSGISYQGSKLDFSFSEGSVTVTVTARAGPWAPPLEAELWPSQDRLPLPPGRQALPDPPRHPGHVSPKIAPMYALTPSRPFSLQDTRSPFPALLAGYKGRTRGKHGPQVLLPEARLVLPLGRLRRVEGSPTHAFPPPGGRGVSCGARAHPPYDQPRLRPSVHEFKATALGSSVLGGHPSAKTLPTSSSWGLSPSAGTSDWGSPGVPKNEVRTRLLPKSWCGRCLPPQTCLGN